MNKYSIKEKWLHQYLHIWADSGIDIDKLAVIIDKSTHPEKCEMHGEILDFIYDYQVDKFRKYGGKNEKDNHN